jgi:hypothetical protein
MRKRRLPLWRFIEVRVNNVCIFELEFSVFLNAERMVMKIFRGNSSFSNSS